MKDLADLTRYQDDFIALAFHGAPPAPSVADLAAQPGFAVYRNTLLKGCIDNLAANFPTVMQLVGAPWFRSAALAYASTAAPTSVSLFDYGATFPAFLAQLPAASDLPYLAGVASLDRLWVECHTAADAPPLSATALASLPPEALGMACLSPHPATRWLTSNAHPCGAIWRAHREQRAYAPASPWGGDSMLLTRIDHAVHWHAIDAGTAALLDACADGCALQDAAAHALAVQPGLDVAASLSILLQSLAFTSSLEGS